MHIAILEDDSSQAALLALWLESAGHTCETYSMGRRFIDNVAQGHYGLLILDWALPDINGDEVLRWVRNHMGWEIPVLFMTFRDESDDIATILELGADDYVTKAVDRIEFLARVTSLERRAKMMVGLGATINLGEFSLNDSEHTVKRHGEDIKLTPMEFKLAKYLFQNVDRLRSRANLLAHVWGCNADVSTRTVDLHVSRLRKKLNLLPENGWQLESVSSVGYRLIQLTEDAQR